MDFTDFFQIQWYDNKGVAYNQPPKKEAQKVDADHSTTHDNESTDEVPAT